MSVVSSEPIAAAMRIAANEMTPNTRVATDSTPTAASAQPGAGEPAAATSSRGRCQSRRSRTNEMTRAIPAP